MDKCSECDRENLILDNYMLICMDCGTINNMTYFVDDRPLFSNNLFTRSNSYKCTNYFKRILRCMQDKSNTHIKKELLNLVYSEKELNNLSTFETLKKYKLFKYYIHIPQIDRILYNKQAIKLSQNDELKLYELFYNILICVRKHLPNRSQCVRYKPVLRLLFILIGRDDIANIIPNIKTKKAKNDFDEICSILSNDNRFSRYYLKIC